ncbi:MAG: glycoside hydrolase family 5 protein [Prevotellaceae bacterium]|jgi:endoglucanase|nr:glycoside hydrolase family 5 protein [Prevotellaceae bacterium]
MKKQLFNLAMAVAATLTVAACGSNVTVVNHGIVSKIGRLSVNGTALVNENGDTVVLQGVSFGWHNWWPQYYNKTTVAWLTSDWKAQALRVAIGVEPTGGYIENPLFALKCATDVIDACIENDLYVYVDWHAHGVHRREAKDFFTTILNKYKGVPNIIYEIFNEPDYLTWDEVKEYSEELIRHIRATDPSAIIVVGNPHWDQDLHVVADNPILGQTNIMYALHFYAATHKEELRSRCEYALSKGIPIIVSECASMESSGNGDIDEASWQQWTEWMDKHKLSRMFWSLANKDETCSMIKAGVEEVSGWREVDLKNWGVAARNTLRAAK